MDAVSLRGSRTVLWTSPPSPGADWIYSVTCSFNVMAVTSLISDVMAVTSLISDVMAVTSLMTEVKVWVNCSFN